MLRKILLLLLGLAIKSSIVTAMAQVAPPNGGRVPIAVVVHTSNTLDGVTLADLRRLYQGDQERWHDGQKVVLLTLPAEHEMRRRFYGVALQSSPSAEFFKPGSPIPVSMATKASTRSVKRFVRRLSNAIGFIPVDEVDDSVKMLSIEGRQPHEDGYVLQ